MKLVGVVFLLFFFSASLAQEDQQESRGWLKKPHIVLIIGDDVGFNDLGFQGANGMPTPTLNNLAAEGVILEDQYVSPWCTPTRAALMTGRYPIRYGLQHIVAVPNQRIALPLTEKILPEFLKEKGYSNHLVGKWHLGMYDPAYLPTSRGFDSFYGTYFNVHHTSRVKSVSNADLTCPASANVDRNARSNACTELFIKLSECSSDNVTAVCQQLLEEYSTSGCFECSFDFEVDDVPVDEARVPRDLPATFSGLNWQEDTPTSFERSTRREGMYSTQAIAEQALEILDAHDETDPLFMTLAFTVVHTPIVLDEQNAAAECSDGSYPYPQRSELCTMVHGMDNAVAQVVQKLKDKDMYDNSVIIFLSDNGGVPFQSSNYPFRGQKSTLWQGGVRVPAFVHAPGRLRETGVTKSGYIHAVDWFTTIRSLARGRFTFGKNAEGLDIYEDDNDDNGAYEDDNDAEFRRRTKIDGKNMWSFLSKKRRNSPRHEILLNIDPLCAIAAVQPQLQTIGPQAAYIFGKWKYFEGDPGIPLLGNCFNGDGSSLPDPTNFYCPFALNADGVGLIDLDNDPTETTNVADANPEIVRLMRLRLEDFEEEMATPEWTGVADPLSDPSLYDGWWTPWVNNPTNSCAKRNPQFTP